MSAFVAFCRRLLTGLVDLTRLIVRELLLGGDPITALLTLVGLCLWAVAFGAGGYLTTRAIVDCIGGLLPESSSHSRRTE